MSPPQRQVVSKACDRCRIRKIKCSGSRPCQRCITTGVQCSYIDIQRMRGPPRGLQRRIGHRSRISDDAVVDAASSSQVSCDHGTIRRLHSKRRPVAISILRRILDLFWSRFYAVWPIVEVDDLLTRITKGDDVDDYALALAVAAATISRLHVADVLPGQCPSAALCALECQRLRNDSSISGDRLNLARLSTSFFLHAYHENISAGSTSSLLHLREAISLAQIMKLGPDQVATPDMPLPEVQLRLKVYMLLFVTERGNSVFHRLPPVLPPPPIQTALSHGLSTATCDSTALVCLADLFAEVERSGMINILGRYGQAFFEDIERLGRLERSLRDRVRDVMGMTKCNMADIDVTTGWLRVLLWNVLHKNGFDVLVSEAEPDPLFHLLDVAEELIATLHRYSLADLEAHGFGMEQKIFQIASILIENVREIYHTPLYSPDTFGARAVLMLKQIHQRLSSFSNGNKALLNDLFAKALEIQQFQSSSVFEAGQEMLIDNSVPRMQPTSGDLFSLFDDWYVEMDTRNTIGPGSLNELDEPHHSNCSFGHLDQP
ncbi:hypothetical protein CDV31_016188 [Fusarium ambrosium]|uniref:Zn(2)-C6 fungal-type domain-containing protein n=1 Tax=Fusarium ambrosium TaxID=131363 RepID=A0A428SDC9_9HYPO|nr:hypothetical protein CDV31_016188 [Fusarium ambrosium]